MFNAVTYLQQVFAEHLTLSGNYTFCRVSGLAALEEILEKSRRTSKFFAIDDSQDGVTFMGAGGYFERRNYTAFIITRAEYGDFTARDTIMAESRTIFRDIYSRIIKDKYSIPVINQRSIAFYEVPPAFATGTCGIYFTFTVENPVDLTYNTDAWAAD